MTIAEKITKIDADLVVLDEELDTARARMEELTREIRDLNERINQIPKERATLKEVKTTLESLES